MRHRSMYFFIFLCHVLGLAVGRFFVKGGGVVDEGRDDFEAGGVDFDKGGDSSLGEGLGGVVVY